MKTPHDDKIDAFAYSLEGGNKAPELPQLYEYEAEDEPEAEPVQWSKHLFATPEQEKQFAEACAAYAEGLKQLADLTRPVFIALADYLKELARQIAPALKFIAEAYNKATAWEKIALDYPNKRIVYLAKHAKKARVRKKNIKKIIEWHERGGH